MNRTMRLERVYRLSDYNTLRVTDELIDLPEEVVKNVKFTELLRTLQLAEIEKTYQKYLLWYKNYIVGKSQEEIFKFIEDVEVGTMKQLEHLFDTADIDKIEGE